MPPKNERSLRIDPNLEQETDPLQQLVKAFPHQDEASAAQAVLALMSEGQAKTIPAKLMRELFRDAANQEAHTKVIRTMLLVIAQLGTRQAQSLTVTDLLSIETMAGILKLSQGESRGKNPVAAALIALVNEGGELETMALKVLAAISPTKIAAHPVDMEDLLNLDLDTANAERLANYISFYVNKVHEQQVAMDRIDNSVTYGRATTQSSAGAAEATGATLTNREVDLDLVLGKIIERIFEDDALHRSLVYALRSRETWRDYDYPTIRDMAEAGFENAEEFLELIKPSRRD